MHRIGLGGVHFFCFRLSLISFCFFLDDSISKNQFFLAKENELPIRLIIVQKTTLLFCSFTFVVNFYSGGACTCGNNTNLPFLQHGHKNISRPVSSSIRCCIGIITISLCCGFFIFARIRFTLFLR